MTNQLITSTSLDHLVDEVEACQICEAHLPFGPRPVVQLAPSATLLIVGQAPGRRVHETGIPWNDPSEDRLRQWLQLPREQFYDAAKVAIMPMGFCYPGTGKSGDLAPRKECAQHWHQRILDSLPNIKLTLLIGQYAQKYYLGDAKLSLTERVKNWHNYLPECLPLPHPSPRNQIWLKKNPWFDKEVVPALRKQMEKL